MNKTETILLFQNLILELEQMKKTQLELKNLILKSHEAITNNQVIIGKKLDKITTN